MQSFLVMVAGAAVVLGHMQMIRPAPIRSPYNLYASPSNYDDAYNEPLGHYPCKGYHHDTPRISTARYKSNETQVLELDGETAHKGGSCQISLSYDGGSTFKVIKSIIGGCPLKTKYEFYVPDSAPSGQALLAWTWLSHEGDRDLYMNCAWVDVESSTPAQTTFEAPNMFVAQLRGHCTVPEYGDFHYPQPGSQIEYGGHSSHYTDKCYNDLRRYRPLNPD